MQLIHMRDATGDLGSPSSQDAICALAGVIGCVGQPDFGSIALIELNRVITLPWWSSYSLHRTRPPEWHAGGSFKAPNGTSEAFRFYREGVYCEDETFQAAGERVQEGGTVITHWNASELPARHRNGIYTRHELRERISLVRSLGRGDLIALNFYRRIDQRPFSTGDFELLGHLAGPLLSCISVHSRLHANAEVSPDMKMLSALPKREREVCERLLRGLTYDGIAADLGISSGTVKTYRDRAFERLEIHHRNELFAMALDAVSHPSLPGQAS